MRTCTRCDETKPESDFYFHSTRGRYEARCKGCFKAVVKARADADRGAVRSANRIAGQKFRDANRERERARVRALNVLAKGTRKAYFRAWQQKNADKHAARQQKRNALKLCAVPAWANLDAIAAIYRQARDESVRTGVPMDVDHIVPLQSKRVCGLHCEANLRILDSVANREKGNRFWPDM